MDNKNLYTSDQDNAPQTPSIDKIEWNSSSVTDKRKESWYLSLVVVSGLISIGLYFITLDFITVGIIMLSVILIAYYGIKTPRSINYSIEGSILIINQRQYDLNKYKHFTISDREKGGSISLIPLKRLSPSITLNFTNNDSEKIINTLGSFMPMEQKENDLFDNLMRYIGF